MKIIVGRNNNDTDKLVFIGFDNLVFAKLDICMLNYLVNLLHLLILKLRIRIWIATSPSSMSSSSTTSTTTTTTGNVGQPEPEGDDLVLIILLSVFIPLIAIALIVIVVLYVRNKRRAKAYQQDPREIVDDMASIQGDSNTNNMQMRNYGSTQPNMRSRVGSEESLGILDI